MNSNNNTSDNRSTTPLEQARHFIEAKVSAAHDRLVGTSTGNNADKNRQIDQGYRNSHAKSGEDPHGSGLHGESYGHQDPNHGFFGATIPHEEAVDNFVVINGESAVEQQVRVETDMIRQQVDEVSLKEQEALERAEFTRNIRQQRRAV